METFVGALATGKKYSIRKTHVSTRSILEAAHAIATDYDPEKDGKLSKVTLLKGVCAREFVQNAVTFPEELKELQRPLRLIGKTAAWYRPVSFAELLDLKTAVPSAQVLGGKHSFPDFALEKPQLISGNTEIGYFCFICTHPPL